MAGAKPRVEFDSRGESGNIYCILARVRTVLRDLGRAGEYDEVYRAVTTSGSYREALGHIREKVDLVDLDGGGEPPRAGKVRS